jgi:hypothetical protein
MRNPQLCCRQLWARLERWIGPRCLSAFDAAKDDSAALAELKAAVAGQVKKLEQLAG